MGCHFSVQVKPWSPQHKQRKHVLSEHGHSRRFQPCDTRWPSFPWCTTLSCHPKCRLPRPNEGAWLPWKPRPNHENDWPWSWASTRTNIGPLVANDATKIASMLQALEFETRLLTNQDATRNNLLREMETCMYQSSTFVVPIWPWCRIERIGHVCSRRRVKMGKPDKVHRPTSSADCPNVPVPSGLFVFDCCFSGTFLLGCDKRSCCCGRGTDPGKVPHCHYVWAGGGDRRRCGDGAGHHSPLQWLWCMPWNVASPSCPAFNPYVLLRSFAISKYHGLVIPKLGRFAGDEGGDTFLTLLEQNNSS